ncbi:hypothetical protein GCM10010401_23440 [Rarobacter faecitabidus]|uniref:Glyoxylase-like metal-dependent hydrolase (Beta-lactamase superfamily II) n=1 Tax=Rarobacter faecitabidus TaxID=13243 RepID=A0A542ZW17_RARFA|nr:MBL fold metallo-hydrolase [Rarobacter faecitabidus]TQL64512.1 glyoxylase-like metal-dependent hydrolase (beta-lactamase superfamily II) [Rarobacter faecitabidus]
MATRATEAAIAGLSAHSQTLSSELGGVRSPHAARAVTPDMLADADLILVSTREHRQEVARTLPRAARKIFTIREFAALAADVPTGTLPSEVATVADLRAAMSAIAARRGLAPRRDPADDDIIDPYRQTMSVYRRMAAQLVPPLAVGASALFGYPIDVVLNYGPWRLATLDVGPMHNNAYVITDNASGEQLLIDAAAEPERILRSFTPERGKQIVTTHNHRDHWAGALAAVVHATGARTLAGAHDADGIAVPTDRRLEDGDTVSVGGLVLNVIALRGHTPGSIALAIEDAEGRTHLFTGDSLFPGGVGKTAGRDEFASLYRDVVRRVFDRYDDATVVHPGHGAPTTLGRERPHLPQWKARGW